jgi:cysteine synthase A
MSQIFQNLVGGTPLIKISEKIYGKLEAYNPTGSVKDRMVSYVVRKAISMGDITQNTVFCEATSGNTGISLAAVAASLKCRCIIYMPCNMSTERKQMMRAYGAEIIETPPSDFDSAIFLRDANLARDPNAWSPKQFSNPDNVECHRTITAPEISKQVEYLGLTWSAFIHGSGTGGTIEGIRQFTQEGKSTSSIKICMVIPEEEKHGIQGIGDGRNFLADPVNMHQVLRVSTPDAVERARKFANETGILVGISSGANMLASERWLEENDCVGVAVTMLCDRGERYMTVY